MILCHYYFKQRLEDTWNGTAQHSTAQHSTAQHSTAQHSTLHRLKRDASGSVALMFAFALLPMLSLAGAGIDYGTAQRMDMRLASAADAASLSAVAATRAELEKNPAATSNAISAGKTAGNA